MTDQVVSGGEVLKGLLGHSIIGYSIGFHVDSWSEYDLRLGEFGVAYFEIGTLIVVVDIASGSAQGVVGLHPHTRWRLGSVHPDVF